MLPSLSVQLHNNRECYLPHRGLLETLLLVGVQMKHSSATIKTVQIDHVLRAAARR